jgi:hypothetical protein
MRKELRGLLFGATDSKSKVKMFLPNPSYSSDNVYEDRKVFIF